MAVIGPPRATDALRRELELAERVPYEIVGRIRSEHDDEPDGEVPSLGHLDDLGRIVDRHELGLLLLASGAPRLEVFDRVARSCLEMRVHLRELASFYETVFGHVPVAEINASWFQYMVHPSFRAGSSAAKRVLDVVAASVVGLAFAPVLLVAAVLIRRDGGPVLFRQVRIGAGGRPFEILKLRTMREDASAAWAGAHDPRVTPIGQLLRRTHLDEVPQVWNILRGDMSIVGPRPEQPAFVERLEHVVPFYTRRHLVKPGLTGWAQVRCGYAGSEIGSAWKVCHDLYYLKHRSLRLDLAILGETVRTLVADRQYTAQPSSVAFIVGPGEATPVPGTPVMAVVEGAG